MRTIGNGDHWWQWSLVIMIMVVVRVGQVMTIDSEDYD